MLLQPMMSINLCTRPKKVLLYAVCQHNWERLLGLPFLYLQNDVSENQEKWHGRNLTFSPAKYIIATVSRCLAKQLRHPHLMWRCIPTSDS